MDIKIRFYDTNENEAVTKLLQDNGLTDKTVKTTTKEGSSIYYTTAEFIDKDEFIISMDEFKGKDSGFDVELFCEDFDSAKKLGNDINSQLKGHPSYVGDENNMCDIGLFFDENKNMVNLGFNFKGITAPIPTITINLKED